MTCRKDSTSGGALVSTSVSSAGFYVPSLLPIPAGLLEDACSTVQANARALAASMTESHRRSGKATALVVGNPLPALTPLPSAEMEAALVARFFSSATVMTGAAVEREKVTDALRDASHLHFACHGLSEPADPLSSALYLGEQKLMARDLLSGDAAPRHARLVMLSACQSAIPDIAHLPDEMVGLCRGEVGGLVNLHYGREPGVKFYTHISDQFGPFTPR